MTGQRYRFSIISIVLVCLVVALVGYLGMSGRVSHADSIVLAFPSSVQEDIVIQSLARLGLEYVAGATNTLVPLSDFSHVASVPFHNADSRVRDGDPRQTPLLDELRSRFRLIGPDGQVWRCLYLKVRGSRQHRDVASAIEELGISWAWNIKEEKNRAAFLWLPGLAWFVWLVSAKPRRSRLARAINALAWVPLLFGSTPGSGLLLIVVLAASMEAQAYREAGRARLAARTLWPYAIATIAIVLYEPGTLAFLALSLVLCVMSHRYGPRIVRLARRNRLHEAPSFIAMTSQIPKAYARSVRRAIFVPLVALLLLFMVAPGKVRQTIEAPYRIVQGMQPASGWARDLLGSHIAFQDAITFGRIGDAGREDGHYVPAYRYRQEDGRMRRLDGTGAHEHWPSDAFELAIKALSEAKPMSIIESALP